MNLNVHNSIVTDSWTLHLNLELLEAVMFNIESHDLFLEKVKLACHISKKFIVL